jgi:hypothetical protein
VYDSGVVTSLRLRKELFRDEAIDVLFVPSSADVWVGMQIILNIFVAEIQ